MLNTSKIPIHFTALRHIIRKAKSALLEPMHVSQPPSLGYDMKNMA